MGGWHDTSTRSIQNLPTHPLRATILTLTCGFTLHRLLLAAILESLPCAPSKVADILAGVFVGIGSNDYEAYANNHFVQVWAGAGQGVKIPCVQCDFAAQTSLWAAKSAAEFAHLSHLLLSTVPPVPPLSPVVLDLT